MITTPPIPLLLSALAGALLVAPAPAQDDDLLVVEKRKDLAARTRMVEHLRRIFVTVRFEDATAQDVARYIQAASGGTVNVIVASKTVPAADLPKVTLGLDKISLANLMSTIEGQTGLRFTFRGGMIFLRPKAEVKEFAYLELYDVRAAVFAVPEFIPPRLGLRPPGEEGGFVGGYGDEPRPINGYDLDRLVDLVRTHAVPESWDRQGISIDGQRGILLVRQTVRGHRATRELLAKLGAIPSTRKVVRRRVAPVAVRPAPKAGKAPARKASRKGIRR